MSLEIAPYRSAVLKAFPELAAARFRFLPSGWHSIAVEADDRLVFKFPKNAEAESALRREAALLAVIRPRLSLAVPALSLHEGPPVFSSHEKLRGEYLLPAGYARLSETERGRLGDALGQLYAELHALDMERMKAAGAEAVGAWLPPQAIREKALPLLPPSLRGMAEAALCAFERLLADPHGETYGFFDGHGWNMAFDPAAARLSGVYDFADSGIGPVHRDFIYSNFISPDLTERIVARYEALTGRLLDRRRIRLLTGVHRLSELAELADDARHRPDMLRHVSDWFARDGYVAETPEN